jgi:hypothetical protein
VLTFVLTCGVFYLCIGLLARTVLLARRPPPYHRRAAGVVMISSAWTLVLDADA